MTILSADHPIYKYEIAILTPSIVWNPVRQGGATNKLILHVTTLDDLHRFPNGDIEISNALYVVDSSIYIAIGLTHENYRSYEITEIHQDNDAVKK